MTRRKPSWFKKTEKLLYEYHYLETAIANLDAERERLNGPVAMMDGYTIQKSTSLVRIGQGATRTIFDSSQPERHVLRYDEAVTRRIDRIRRVDALLTEKRRIIGVIESARRKLTEEELTFVWLRYDHGKPHDEARELLAEQGFPMSRGTYFNMRRRVVEKFAKFFGFL